MTVYPFLILKICAHCDRSFRARSHIGPEGRTEEYRCRECWKDVQNSDPRFYDERCPVEIKFYWLMRLLRCREL